jgi:hypothetical protein
LKGEEVVESDEEEEVEEVIKPKKSSQKVTKGKGDEDSSSS